MAVDDAMDGGGGQLSELKSTAKHTASFGYGNSNIGGGRVVDWWMGERRRDIFFVQGD